MELHGIRLIHNAKHGEESLRIPCETAYLRGDFLDFVAPEPVQGGVAERR